MRKPAVYSNVINAGGFFSDYFLGNILNERSLKGKLGESTVNEAYRWLLYRFDRYGGTLGDKTSLSEMWNIWLKHIFQKLGFSPLWRNSIETEKGEIKISAIEKYNNKPLVIFRFLRFGESLDAAEGLARSPHKELVRALYYAKAPYGILTNGKVIRLIRNSPLSSDRSYLEVDLWRTFELEDRDSFRVFWAIFRKEAFVPDESGKSLIEVLEEESRKHAIRVGDELRESAFRALERFIRGVLEDESNKDVVESEGFDLEKLYQESLVYLYRILFLLYAESTELLPVGNPLYRNFYSLEFLRDLVADPRNSFHPNSYFLWESLKATFKLINEGFESSELHVPAYNGKLFSESSTPLLNRCRVSDSVMAEVIRDLTLTAGGRGRTREVISYRELGIEQLGSIYEGLLELEPKIAEEDLVVVKIKGEFQTVPKSRLRGERIIEEIPEGRFYLGYWGGRRKSTGTYYTPRQITEFLMRSALEPLVDGKSSEDILEIKVLDPAMGSGAFLVAAVNFLAEKYKEALLREGLIAEEDIDSEKEAEFKRLVVENCIYGVDLNPLAVELAKVSLWLTTMAKGKPLTFLDHKLKCGNSLIGADHERVKFVPDELFSDRELRRHNKRVREASREVKYFFTAEGKMLENPLSYMRDVIELRQKLNMADEALSIVKFKEELYSQLVKGEIEEGKLYLKLKRAYDLWCSFWFTDKKIPTTDEYIEILRYILEDGKGNESFDAMIEEAERLAQEYKFFHWELEFPEVFAEGGFDAVVGNPPWDIVKPNSDEFFSNYDPYFRDYTKQKKLRVMRELMEANPAIKKSWREYKDKIERQSYYFRNSGYYPHQYQGDINLYKLFLERFFWLIRERGRMSIIVPSGLYTDKGCAELRRMFLENSRISYLIGIENRMKIFPSIDIRFKYTLFSALKEKQEEDYSFRAGFFIGSRPEELRDEELDPWEVLQGSFAPKAEELDRLLPMVAENGLRISRKLIERFSPDTLSIMEFKRQEDIDLAEKIYDDWPLLGESDENYPWNVKFTTEFHMTNDSHLFVTLDKLKEMGTKPLDEKGLRWLVERNGKKEVYLPLYEGKMIWQFDAFYEKPQYWISEEVILNRLADKGVPVFPRSIYRAIASNTNERTLVSCVLPVFSFKSPGCGHSLNSITINAQDLFEHFFFNSIFNSYIVDYVIRQKVTTNLTMFYLYQLPIPRLTSGNWYFDQIVPRAARLICVDEEFAELWEETYQPYWNTLGKTSRVEGWERLSEKWSPEYGVADWVYINNEKRDGAKRAQLRAEIDALVAHLYGLTRVEFAYILDTFPVLRRKETEAFGEFRTKRLCLEEYERLGKIIAEEKKKSPESFDLSKYKKGTEKPLRPLKKFVEQVQFTRDGKIIRTKRLGEF